MKIAFVTSCLEPGQDGVGDYTRDLSEECARQGHTCFNMAINDTFATGTSKSQVGSSETARFSRAQSWESRVEAGRAMLEAFKPDWISLQFVCYGYDNRGFVYSLAGQLKKLLRDFRLQVMLHELWIGQSVDAGLKERFVGAVQKRMVLRLLRMLNPEVVHTSNALYAQVLGRAGVSVAELPLFSNIPIVKNSGDEKVASILRTCGLDLTPGNRGQHWLFGIFGSLHPIWPEQPLFSYLEEAGRIHHKQVSILSIGRIGPGAGLWKQLSKTYSKQFGFIAVGEHQKDLVSGLLAELDFGIATTPYDLIGKSGSVAAMLEHGVPVIVNRVAKFTRTFESAREPADPLLYKMDSQLPRALANLKHRAPRARLSEIGARFIQSFTPHSARPSASESEIFEPSGIGMGGPSGRRTGG